MPHSGSRGRIKRESVWEREGTQMMREKIVQEKQVQ